MKTRAKRLIAALAVLSIILVLAAWAAVPYLRTRELRLDVRAVPETGLSLAQYAEVLKRHVDDRGMVDYPALKADVVPLDAFLAAAGALDSSVYQEWTDRRKIAFWTNVYNAFTLKAIVVHYPIGRSVFTALFYPAGSIRQIPRVWDNLWIRVMGQSMTLNQIEHEVLRRQFGDPRIHVALVCAAMGCPPLRNEPYVADRLDEQFEDQAKRFLTHPEKFRIDRQQGVVYLSSIFKWFGADFTERHGTEDAFTQRGQPERAVLSYVAAHVSEADREYLEQEEYTIQYLDYDWSLNEQGR